MVYSPRTLSKSASTCKTNAIVKNKQMIGPAGEGLVGELGGTKDHCGAPHPLPQVSRASLGRKDERKGQKVSPFF